MILNKKQWTYHCELCGYFIISCELYETMRKEEVIPAWKMGIHICKHCGTPITWHEVNERVLNDRKYGYAFDKITGEKIDVRDQKEFEFKF